MPHNSTIEPLELLLQAIHRISAELKKGGFSHSDESLPVAARGLLQSLQDQGPKSVPALARLGSSSRQNVQIMANRLQRIGCVEFVPNSAHKRSALLRLTSKGQAALAASKQHENRLLETLTSHFSPVELAATLGFLKRLKSALTEGRDASTVAPSPRTVRAVISQPYPGSPAPRARSSPRPRKMHPPKTEISESVPEETLDDNFLPYNLL
jgi:DNA-binding MarR family transcriptional regulator